jgi:hypothetical protein
LEALFERHTKHDCHFERSLEGRRILVLFDVPFNVTNLGKTSARDMKYVLRAEFIRRDSDPELTYPPLQTAGGDMTRMGAGITPTLDKPTGVSVKSKDGTPFKIGHSDISDFLAGEKDIIVYGKISFWDTFGVHHWMHSCNAYQKLTEGPLKDSGHQKCNAYNKTDRNSILPKDTSLAIQEADTSPEMTCIYLKPEPETSIWEFWK